jgi:hypothetical protein
VTEATVQGLKDSTLYTVPKANGEAPLPRRAGTRTMLPSSWLARAVKIEYVGASGELQHARRPRCWTGVAWDRCSTSEAPAPWSDGTGWLSASW